MSFRTSLRAPRPALFIAALIAGCASTQAARPGRSPNTVLFGVIAYSGNQSGEMDASAIEAALAHRLNHGVTAVVFGDESSLAAALAQGVVDAAWMPPLAFLEARARTGVTPLVQSVRRGSVHYRSVVFSRADRGYTTLKDLHGVRVAWVDHHSAAGYLLPLSMIRSAGLSPGDLFAREDFLGDHAAVCRAVLDGSADVGATFADDHPDGTAPVVDGCVQTAGSEQAAKLAVLSTSRPVPNDVVAVRPDFPPALAGELTEAFLSFSRDGEGKSILSKVFKADAFGRSDLKELGFDAGSSQ
jgi:phosphonate transport system substrate-binding protein